MKPKIRKNLMQPECLQYSYNSVVQFLKNMTSSTKIDVRFSVGKCSLGSVLVAATKKGICAVTFADDPEPLIRDLQDRFPTAELTGAAADIDNCVSKIVELVEHPEIECDLPLDVQGTDFQQRVWQALRTIPLGHTASYAEIAKRIGRPTAVRAVAQACGANNIAVVIPCHRIVRTDGGISGYRWGVQRKVALLKREQENR
jgi:AraC family transcriptional regulator of adaptative response/methylated-DNA-[protein]-cysteine methyltransferase